MPIGAQKTGSPAIWTPPRSVTPTTEYRCPRTTTPRGKVQFGFGKVSSTQMTVSPTENMVLKCRKDRPPHKGCPVFEKVYLVSSTQGRELFRIKNQRCVRRYNLPAVLPPCPHVRCPVSTVDVEIVALNLYN